MGVPKGRVPLRQAQGCRAMAGQANQAGQAAFSHTSPNLTPLIWEWTWAGDITALSPSDHTSRVGGVTRSL